MTPDSDVWKIFENEHLCMGITIAYFADHRPIHRLRFKIAYFLQHDVTNNMQRPADLSNLNNNLSMQSRELKLSSRHLVGVWTSDIQPAL